MVLTVRILVFQSLVKQMIFNNSRALQWGNLLDKSVCYFRLGGGNKDHCFMIESGVCMEEHAKLELVFSDQ